MAVRGAGTLLVPADLSRAVTSAVACGLHKSAVENEDIRPLTIYLEDPTYCDTTYQVPWGLVFVLCELPLAAGRLPTLTRR